ncbi:MAG TPA: 23S rRNA (cytidine(2498)-2'-O)-methyltransferase RlmM [Pseudomonadota bacterium]|nr:23S rRNA (cytidine(2498)-2'-O)-methyltransferase RlmM [Pseudomonadota bacterium]
MAVGDWLWACRAGAEPDLCDELRTYGLSGWVLQPGLCASPARPRTAQKEDAELTFARQGMPVQAVGAADVQFLAKFIGEVFADRRQAQRGSGLALHVFAADSDAGNLLAAVVLELQARLSAALVAAGVPLLPDARTAHAEGGKLAQVCLLTAEQVAVGVLPARAAPSLFPGGRQRFKKPKDAPARSALKLTEALAWLGHGPQAGEVCVDLGAAPGGWSQVLLERRCHVVAIDPGRMAPHLVGRLEHLRTNAFTFEPELPADWVLCDMAYRPLEVAGLLAKWGRRRWAQFLLANIKLPMNRRVDMLARVREILTTGGWTGLRMRQLYHDRDEVTLSGWRGFGVDTRVQRSAPTAADAPAPAATRPRQRPPRPRTAATAKPKASAGRSGGAAKPKAPPTRGRPGSPAKPKAPPPRGRRSTPVAPSHKPPRPRR